MLWEDLMGVQVSLPLLSVDKFSLLLMQLYQI